MSYKALVPIRKLTYVKSLKLRKIVIVTLKLNYMSSIIMISQNVMHVKISTLTHMNNWRLASRV